MDRASIEKGAWLEHEKVQRQAAEGRANSLTAENRLLLTAVRNVKAALERGQSFDPASTGLYDPRLNAPHTAREVERVKALEGVVTALRQYKHIFYSVHDAASAGGQRIAHDAMFESLAALDKLKGGE